MADQKKALTFDLNAILNEDLSKTSPTPAKAATPGLTFDLDAILNDPIVPQAATAPTVRPLGNVDSLAVQTVAAAAPKPPAPLSPTSPFVETRKFAPQTLRSPNDLLKKPDPVVKALTTTFKGGVRTPNDLIKPVKVDTLPKLASPAIESDAVKRLRELPPEQAEAWTTEWAKQGVGDFFESLVKKDGDSPIGYSLTNKGLHIVPFLGTSGDAMDAFNAIKANAKIADGTATENDRAVVMAFQTRDDADKERATNGLYRAMSTLWEMPAFGVEIALTKGVFGGVRKAIEEGALKLLLPKIAANAISGVAAAAAQTAVAGSGKVASSAMSAVVPDPIRSPDGTALKVPQPNRGGVVIPEAFLNQLIEYGTEHMGGMLTAPFKKLSAVQQLAAVREGVMSTLMGPKGAGVRQALSDLAEKTQWNGQVGELFEEYAGDVLHALNPMKREKTDAPLVRMVTGQPTPRSDPKKNQRLEAWHEFVQNSLEMAATFAVPGLIGGAAGTIANLGGSNNVPRQPPVLGKSNRIEGSGPEGELATDVLAREQDRRGAITSNPASVIAPPLQRKPSIPATERVPSIDDIKVQTDPVVPNVGTSENTAGVPFMVTRAMRQELQASGLTDEQIDAMTPTQAWEALRPEPTTIEEALADPPTTRSTPKVVPIVAASGAETKPGGYYLMKPTDLRVDPDRFQFKSNSDAQGVTADARIEGPWNDNRSGILLAWRDPETSELFVINGHHRLEAATRLGAEQIVVHVVGDMTAEEARVEGALTNIAEDKGTPVDAAKVIRQVGLDGADLQASGINPKTRLARDGVALAKLSDPIFHRVAIGDIDTGIGVAIGDSNLSPESQAAVVAILEKHIKDGREVTPGQVRSFIKDVQSAPEVAVDDAQGNIFADLFNEDRKTNLALDKAALRDRLMTTLSKDKRLFGYVAKGDRAERLKAGGNRINQKASAKIAEDAARIQAVVEKLAYGAGPINDALNSAVTRIAQGESDHVVFPQLIASVREAVHAELRGKARVPKNQRGQSQEDPRGHAPDDSTGVPDAEGADPVTKRLYQRPSSSTPVFYSELARQIQGARITRATPKEWASFITNLKGVKKDEVEWSGVTDWLKLSAAEMPIDKSAVLDYLRQNHITVEERLVGGESSPEVDVVWSDWREISEAEDPDLNGNIREFVITGTNGSDFKFRVLAQPVSGGFALYHFDEGEWDSVETFARFDQPLIEREAWEVVGEYHPADGWGAVEGGVVEQDFEDYTAPGGTNYKVLLLTVPQVGKMKGVGHSGHFSTDDIVAHFRAKDRVGANGEKVLFIEEVQSDWGQKGREEGFAGQPVRTLSVEQIAKALRQTFGRGHAIAEKVVEAINLERDDAKLDDVIAQVIGTFTDKPNDVELVNQAIRDIHNSGSPRGPFVTSTKSWVSLTMKRIIRWASENGYERVAWTPGDVQNERYNLAKEISGVSWFQMNGQEGDPWGTLFYRERGTGRKAEKSMRRSELPSHIGQDLTDRLLATKADDIPGRDGPKIVGSRHDLDLVETEIIGGHGHRAFYDEMLPIITNDLLKKFGGDKVEPMRLARPTDMKDPVFEGRGMNVPERAQIVSGVEDGYRPGRHDERMAMGMDDVPSFAITDKLRDRALEGLPLFQKKIAKQSVGWSASDPNQSPMDPRPWSVENLRESFGLTDEQAVATDAVARAIFSPSELAKLTRIGIAPTGQGGLFQSAPPVTVNTATGTATFKTGTPVTFPFMRRTTGTQNFGSRFGQDIEPAGRYMVLREKGITALEDQESGDVTFENPLVFEWNGYQMPTGWKEELSKQFGGKTGMDLSQAVRLAGYDGIVTVTTTGREPYVDEIVDLTGIKAPKNARTPNLFVQHNLTAANLRHALKVGGLAMPSVAVSRAADPMQSFGEITLIGPSDMAIPAKDRKFYPNDMYSPRYPNVTFALDKMGQKKLDDILKPYSAVTGQNYYDLDEVQKEAGRYLQSDPRAIAAFLDSKGLLDKDALEAVRQKAIAKPRRKNELVADKYRGDDAVRHELRDTIYKNQLSDELTAYADEMFRSLEPSERIFRGFTNNGNRRYTPHTLDNVIRIMKAQLKDGEGSNLYGMGQLRSRIASEFRTRDQIIKAEGRLVSKADMKTVKDDIDEKFFALAERVPRRGSQDFNHSDSVIAAIEDTLKMGAKKAFKEYGFEIGDETARDVYEFINELRNLPTGYFEGKILRAVNPSEFVAAVVPKDVPADVRAALERKGLDVVEYDGDSDRADKIRQVAREKNVLFQPAYHGSPSTGVRDLNRSTLSGRQASARGVVPSTPNKRLSDRARVAVENISKALVSEAGVRQSFRQIDVEGRARVLTMMRALFNDAEIRKEIVPLVPVNVMNMLGSEKTTPKMLLDDPSVFIDLLSVNPDKSVGSHLSVLDALTRAVIDTSIPQPKVEFEQRDAPFDGAKGMTEIMVDGTLVLSGLTAPDVTTGVHELAHVIRQVLFNRERSVDQRNGITDEDIDTAEQWVGVKKGGRWSEPAEEKFARGFERYLAEGKTANPKLNAIFAKFKEWILDVYKRIAGSDIDIEISPAMREVFDRLLTRQDRIALAEAQAARASRVDVMSNGERQARLPGDVGDVRDVEVRDAKLGDEAALQAKADADKAAKRPVASSIAKRGEDWWKVPTDAPTWDGPRETKAPEPKRNVNMFDEDEKGDRLFQGTNVHGNVIEYITREVFKGKDLARSIRAFIKKNNGTSNWALGGQVELEFDDVLDAYYRDKARTIAEGMKKLGGTASPEVQRQMKFDGGVKYFGLDAEKLRPYVDNEMTDRLFQAGTPAFDKWFGDSKIVDEDGKPMRLYHGTADVDRSFSQDGQKRGEFGYAFYLTDKPRAASEFAKHRATDRRGNAAVLPVYVKMERPLVVGSDDYFAWMKTQKGPTEMIVHNLAELAKASGYDGLISEWGNYTTETESPRQFIVFSPTQIKSAIGNAGTFDPKNPNILFQREGKVPRPTIALDDSANEIALTFGNNGVVTSKQAKDLRAAGFTPVRGGSWTKAVDAYSATKRQKLMGEYAKQFGATDSAMDDVEVAPPTRQPKTIDLNKPTGLAPNVAQHIKTVWTDPATRRTMYSFPFGWDVDVEDSPVWTYLQAKHPDGELELYEAGEDGITKVIATDPKTEDGPKGQQRLFQKPTKTKDDSEDDFPANQDEWDRRVAKGKIEEAKIEAEIAKMPYAAGASLQSTKDPNRKLIIHPSTMEPGQWQITAFDKDGPWGHTNEATFADAYRSARGVWVKGAAPYGGREYVLDEVHSDRLFQAKTKTKEPTQPKVWGDEPFLKDGDPIPEIVGNIRMSKFDLPDVAKRELANIIHKQDGYIEQRRGVRSWDTTAAAADLLPAVTQIPKKGTAFNAEEVTALGGQLQAIRQQLADLGDDTSIQTDIQRAKLQATSQVLLAAYAGARSEMGRGLNILRRVNESILSKDDRQMLDALKAAGFSEDGKMMKKVRAALDSFGDDDVAKYRFLRNLNRPDWADYLTWFWYTNLLSGPLTHVRNITGNTAMLAQHMASLPFAAGIDLISSKLTGRARSVMLGEIPMAMHGMSQGAIEGAAKALFMVKHGFTLDQVASAEFTPSREVFNGAMLPNLVGRSLEGMDLFYRAINFQTNLYGMAHNAAVEAGLDEGSDEGAEFVRRFLADPPKDAVETAARQAAEAIFRGPHGKVITALKDMRGNWKWTTKSGRKITIFNPLRLFLPFVETPANILKKGAEFSPIGFVMAQNKETDREKAMSRGRAALGTMLLTPIVMMAAKGLISGNGPDDKELKDHLYRTGWKPNSVKLGGTWFSYQAMQPLSLPLATVANAFEAYTYTGKTPSFAQIGARVANSVLQQSFLSGVMALEQALMEPDRRAQAFGQKMQTGFIPLSGLWGQTARAIDPVIRQPEGTKEALKAVIPGLSKSVRPRLDAFGDESTRGEDTKTGLLSRLFNPFTMSPEIPSKLEDELGRLSDDLQIGFPGDKITLKGQKFTMTTDEYQKYAKASGQKIKKILALAVENETWMGQNDEDKIKQIKSVIDRVRATERKVVLADMLRRLLKSGEITREQFQQ